MNTIYAFGIGGTGALAVEALVHLCATGQGPDRLVPLLLDPDASNGNVKRTSELIRQYRAVRESLEPNYKDGAFRTVIELAEGTLHWSPLARYEANNLAGVIRETEMDAPVRLLTKALFSQAQLNQQLDQGFRGNPSIGSVLMSAIEDAPFFSHIASRLQNDQQGSSLFLFASIFGGTGAAGLPVTARLIQGQAPDARVGGAIFLPYFSISEPGLDAVRGNELVPHTSQFIVNAAGALPHYFGAERDFASIYFLGDGGARGHERSFAAGGEDQANAPHPLELVGALGALHFSRSEGDLAPNYYTAAGPSHYDWGALPGLERGRFDVFTSFAIFYQEVFGRPLAHTEAIAAVEAEALKQAWISEAGLKGSFFRDHRTDLLKLAEYLESYLRWVHSMHSSAGDLNVYNRDLRLDRYQMHAEPRARRILGVPTSGPDRLRSIAEANRFCNKVRIRSHLRGTVTGLVDLIKLGMDQFNQDWYRLPAVEWERIS